MFGTKFQKNTPSFLLTALTLAILLSSALVGNAQAQSQSAQNTISLSGIGEMSATPDMAIISSGILTQGKTARVAMQNNNQAMGEIFDLLADLNIEARDIQTSNFSIQPQYIYSDERDANGYARPPRIAGYQVSNMLSIQVRDLDRLGELLDRLVQTGSNQINGISFAVDDPASLINGARRAAMADAIAKAQLYAQAAGVKLGNIISISEGQQYSAPPPDMMPMARVMSDSADVPIASGELNFTKQVFVVWHLSRD